MRLDKKYSDDISVKCTITQTVCRSTACLRKKKKKKKRPARRIMCVSINEKNPVLKNDLNATTFRDSILSKTEVVWLGSYVVISRNLNFDAGPNLQHFTNRNDKKKESLKFSTDKKHEYAEQIFYHWQPWSWKVNILCIRSRHTLWLHLLNRSQRTRFCNCHCLIDTHFYKRHTSTSAHPILLSSL